jgi:4-amino-4-deoxy-L-arabinose transferase-like glycosyltransferase
MESPSTQPLKTNPWCWICSVLTLFLLGWGLWEGSLVNSDDVIYAQMALESYNDGRWMEHSWMGTILYEKPPLLFWLLELSGMLFGFDNFGMRLPAMVAALLSCFFVYKITLKITQKQILGMLAVAFTLGSVTFIIMARRVMTDPLLVASMLGMIWSAMVMAESPGWRPAVLLGLAAGLALLAKSLAVGPVVLGIMPIVWDKRCVRYIAMAIGVALLVALPWHLWMAATHGAEFWEVYLGYHVVERAGTALTGNNGPGYYLSVFLEQETILGVLLLMGSVVGIGLALKQRDRRLIGIGAVLLLHLVTIHLMGTRLFHYLLPVIPLMAMLTVSGLVKMIEVRTFKWGAVGLLLVIFLMGSLSWVFSNDHSPQWRRVGEEVIRKVPKETRIVVFNAYAPALFHYADRRGEFWTDDPNEHRRLNSIDMLRRADVMRYATPSAWSKLLANRQSVLFIVSGKHVNRLRESLRDALESNKLKLRDYQTIGDQRILSVGLDS